MGILNDKRILITGLANKRSIAYGIATAMHREGAQLAFTYMSERFQERVAELARQFDSDIVLPCNVESDADIQQLHDSLQQQWGHVDGMVHSIAFAPSELIGGDFIDNMTRDGFNKTHEISVYSFMALVKALRPLMQGRQASVLTLSYLGAMRTLPNYNLMGVAKAALEASTRYMSVQLGPEQIRVNAISAGPIRTLAASGISDFRKILDFVAEASPMPGNISIEQVGDTAAFLSSSWASGITGQTIYVDNGFNITAMPGTLE